MNIENSSSANPQENCEHLRWIVDNSGRFETCKNCGFGREVPVWQHRLKSNFSRSAPKPAYEKRPKAVTGNQISSLGFLKYKIQGLTDIDAAERLGARSTTTTKKVLRDFLESKGVQGKNERQMEHQGIQKLIASKVIPIEELDLLPDTKPDLTDGQKIMRELYASGFYPREIAETMHMPINRATEMCSAILDQTGVGNSYALAAWVAREKIRERQLPPTPQS